MMPSFEALLHVGVFVYFLFGEVQIVFQSVILVLFRYHKNTSQNATKCKMYLVLKTTREDYSRVA